MTRNRRKTACALLRGLLCAVLFTLAAMLILAAALVWLRFGDSLLTVFNQLIKYAAVTLGTVCAVPRGGSRGLASGVALALGYIAAGYALCIALGGGSFSTAGMLGEMLVGSAVGGVTGAVRANMNPRRGRSASLQGC